MKNHIRHRNIKMNYLLLLLCLILTYSCKPRNDKVKTALDYNIQIEYLSTPISDQREMYSDSLVIDFVGNYHNDTITLYLNGEKYCTKVFTTDEVVGRAGNIVAPKYGEITEIGIRINNGKLIYIEPESRHYNIQVDFVDKNAVVRFYRYLPAGM